MKKQWSACESLACHPLGWQTQFASTVERTNLSLGMLVVQMATNYMLIS
jgi:hypothetical protein